MLCKKIMLYGKRLFVATVLLTTASRAEAQEVALFDFGNFNEDNWIQVRDPAVKEIGRFVQNDGYIQNFVKPEHIDKHALEAGHALRLLKDNTFKNGRIETELMLVGKAAPSIYFRTRVEKEVHLETYNLVVFDFSGPNNKDYRGLNLWKWKKEWPPDAKSYSNWVLLASWAFPVPLNEKIKIAVETSGPDIKVFFNDQLKGTVYDPDYLKEGAVGICSCEGRNNFYNFKVTKTK